jgi:hypothetical protein
MGRKTRPSSCREGKVILMSITIKPVEKPAMSKIAGAVLCG